MAWAANIATRARHEGLIREDVSVKSILDELNATRSKLGALLDYDWVSMPLVYTQVCIIMIHFNLNPKQLILSLKKCDTRCM